MAKKLYVGNLNYDIDTETLTDWFSAYGTVESANIINDPNTGRSRGYGFVEMGTEEEAQAAIEGLNDSEQQGRHIKVAEASPSKPRGGGRGPGGGGKRFGGGGGGGGGGYRSGNRREGGPGGGGGRGGQRGGGGGGGGGRGPSSGNRRSSY